jgi:hypothetical protein
MGRHPLTKQFSHGSSSILDFAAATESKCEQGKQELPVKLSDSPTGTDHAKLSTHGALQVDKITKSTHPEAPGYSKDAIPDKVVLTHTSNLSCVNPFGNIHTQKLVRSMLESKDQFYETHRFFMIGKSFANDFQSISCQLLDHSPRILTDAYHAVFELMSYGPSDRLTLVKGADCIRTLLRSTASILEAGDAAVVLMLGQILLVYNALARCSSTHIVTQGVLLATKDWYPTLLNQPELNCVTLTPVFVDTIQCLVRREVPVVRLSISDRAAPDRFIGLLSSLLPLLYDLCEISHNVKSNGSALVIESEEDQYLIIEHKIKVWQPLCPDPSSQGLAPVEVTMLTTQAQLYRMAALLVIHRLRYPLGVQDRVASYYAKAIVRGFRIFQGWCVGDASGFGVNFPLLMASLEVPDLVIDVMETLEPLRPDSPRSRGVLEFALFARMQQSLGFSGLWFELFNDELCGIILP